MFYILEIWHHIWRNKGRSLLSIGIAAVLVSFVGLYIGNIRKNELALKSLADTIPVKVQVTNRNGSRLLGLEITSKSLNALLSAGIKDPVYTARAGGKIEPVNQMEYVRICDTYIVGVNSLHALPAVGSDEIAFEEGFNESYLEGDQSQCVVTWGYARKHDISIGDTLSFPMYVYKFSKDDSSFRYIAVGEQELTVIGILGQDSGTSDGTIDMLVPVKWMQSAVEEAGVDFNYDSAYGMIQDPLKLNEFKAHMEEARFREVKAEEMDTRSGDGLIIQDKIFIETASKLQENIKMLSRFQFPFYICIVLLVILVSFLVLRSYRQEIAIASSQGRPRLDSAVSLFFENLLLYLVGCIVATPVLMGAVGVSGVSLLLINLIFLSGAGIGIGGALALLLRFDTLVLLTRID